MIKVWSILILINLFQIEPNKKELALVWSDEFNYTGHPDPLLWTYDEGDGCNLACGCGWGNNELQYYTKDNTDNARVENGNLIIELNQAKEDGKFNSARIVSRGAGEWKYGTFEIKAKIPKGIGVWSAIWMLPSENNYGIWPRSGEIDIMENVGFAEDTIVSSVHTLNFNHGIGTHKNGKIHVDEAHEEFQIYKLTWDEKHFKVSVNDIEVFEYNRISDNYGDWPFDKKFYLLMNIAYGGNWGGMKGVHPEELPAKMYIDYVRVYQ